MSSFSMFVVVFLTVGSAVTVYGEENFNITSNVSISLNKPDACPYEPVTAQCNVTGPSNLFLSWDCQASNERFERLVFCDQMAVDLDCEFGTVYDISSNCVCNDTVIISEATFDLSPMGDMMLFCSNGESDQRQGVPVSVKALETPVLNYTMAKIDDDVYKVTLWWTINEDPLDDVSYDLLVVATDSSTQNHTNNASNLTQISLCYGTEYEVTVTALRCGGNVTSEPSEPLLLYFPEITSSRPASMSVTPPTQSTTNVTLAVGLSVGAIIGVVILIIIIAVLCLLNKSIRSVVCQTLVPQHSAEDVDSPPEVSDGTIEQIHDYPGDDITSKTEKDKFKRKEQSGRSRTRTAVGALFVEEDTIYYSCKELTNSSSYKFLLVKCTENGTVHYSIPGFNHVRGIGKDSDGYFYASDSLSGNRVIKFDKNWNPLRKTNRLATELLDAPYGIYVERLHIFVCAKDKICILDNNLKICYTFKLQLCPIDITKFKGSYFVTSKSAIMVIDIDLSKLKFTKKVFDSIIMPGRSTETFNKDCDLRGICATDKYLYVTEKGPSGRLLCLDYDEGKLRFIAADESCAKHCSQSCSKNCSPVVVAEYKGKIYYSQGTHERKYHIVRVTHGAHLESKKIFDV